MAVVRFVDHDQVEVGFQTGEPRRTGEGLDRVDDDIGAGLIPFGLHHADLERRGDLVELVDALADQLVPVGQEQRPAAPLPGRGGTLLPLGDQVGGDDGVVGDHIVPCDVKLLVVGHLNANALGGAGILHCGDRPGRLVFRPRLEAIGLAGDSEGAQRLRQCDRQVVGSTALATLPLVGVAGCLAACSAGSTERANQRGYVSG
jgi:hypothetical protein